MESCSTSGATNDMSLILKLLIVLMGRLNPLLCSTSLAPVLPSICFRLLLLRTCSSTLRWLSRRPSRLDAWLQHLAMFSVCNQSQRHCRLRLSDHCAAHLNLPYILVTHQTTNVSVGGGAQSRVFCGVRLAHLNLPSLPCHSFTAFFVSVLSSVK